VINPADFVCSIVLAVLCVVSMAGIHRAASQTATRGG
jgi:hypothetical protein